MIGAEIIFITLISILVLIPNNIVNIFYLIGGFVEIHIFETLPTSLYFFIFLVTNVAWIVLNVRWPLLKSIYIRIFIVWLVFILSAIIMSCLFFLEALHGAFV